MFRLATLVLGPLFVGTSTVAGTYLLQTVPISEQTTVTFGLGISAVAGAFWIGTVLTAIKKDIARINHDLNERPCMVRQSNKCPSDKE